MCLGTEHFYIFIYDSLNLGKIKHIWIEVTGKTTRRIIKELALTEILCWRWSFGMYPYSALVVNGTFAVAELSHNQKFIC